MTAGREIGGFPKKLGRITFSHTPIYVSTLDSPDGLQICSGELQAFAKVGEQKDFPPAMQRMTMPFLSLRVIPDPASEKAPFSPSLCQLIYTEWVLERGTFWSGRGRLSMTGASALNPYHALPVVAQAPPMSPAIIGAQRSQRMAAPHVIGRVVSMRRRSHPNLEPALDLRTGRVRSVG